MKRNQRWGQRTLERLRQCRENENGAVLAIVAILMVPVFIPLAALAVDVGSYYQSQRQAQAAADAGALAASQDLPTVATAKADGNTYALKNYPGATITVTTPYNSNANQVQVIVTASTPTFFGKFMGFPSRSVSATSVAGLTGGATPCASTGNGCYAMFAADSSCAANGVSLGGGVHITGGVHSNGSLYVGGGGSSFGPTTYGNGSGCTVTPVGYAGQSNTFTSGPTAETAIPSWPIDYSTDFPPCTTTCSGPGGTPSFCTSSSTAPTLTLQTYTPTNLISGQIYCGVGTGTAATPSTWNGVLTINGGPVTSSFVAGSITFGGGTNLTACGYVLAGYSASSCSATVPAPVTTNYPVAYAVKGDRTSGTTKLPAIDDSGGGASFTGDMFAPLGTIAVGGGTDTTFLEALDISAPGGGFTGDGPIDSGSGGSSSGVESLLQ